jgi:GNAT superfamily N-acetyltransferase
MPMRVVSVEPSHPFAVLLMDEMSAEMAERYRTVWPMDGRSNYRPEHFDPASDRFLVGLVGGEPVCCGALRRFGPGVVEVKRMFVRVGARRRGLARGMLQRLERLAGAMGYAEIVLETGSEQPDAIALYTGAGYVPTAPWPPYDERPYANCFRKRLDGGT